MTPVTAPHAQPGTAPISGRVVAVSNMVLAPLENAYSTELGIQVAMLVSAGAMGCRKESMPPDENASALSVSGNGLLIRVNVKI